MSTMIYEVYDALKEAGASEGKAKAAAEAVAHCNERFNKIEAELLVVKWMVGACLALTGSVAGLLVNIMIRGIKVSA
jgi:hypothetical protein